MMTDMRVLELGDALLLDLPLRGHAGGPRPPGPFHLQRGRAGRRRDGGARRDRDLRPGRGGRPRQGRRPKAMPPSSLFESTRVRLAGADVDRRPQRRSRVLPATTSSSTRADAEAVTAALLAAGRRPRDRRGRRSRAHRERPSALRRRHGRGHDSARSRARGARDLAEQGLLRRPGSDRPRPGSRSWPRGEAPRRAHVRCRRAGSGAGARIVSGEREIGRVTSATWSPALGRPIALGYVHRDFVEPGTRSPSTALRAVSSPRCRSSALTP